MGSDRQAHVQSARRLVVIVSAAVTLIIAGLAGSPAASGAELGPEDFDPCMDETTGGCPPIEEPSYDSTATGELPFHTFVRKSLSDRMGVAVNVATGNLLVKNSDLKIAGTGLDFQFGRAYNSLSPGSGSISPGWKTSTGEDLRIRDNADGSVTFYGASGYVVTFTPTSGGFATPPGLRATLKRLTDTTYELTENPTGERLSFTSAGRGSWGRLTAHADRYGNSLSFAYSSDKLSSITDTQGRVTTVAQDGAGRLARLTDSTGRSVRYGYSATGRLDSYTDGDDKTTGYGYDLEGRLNSITSPGGRVTKVTYDGRGRVETLMQTTDAAHTSGPTTTFSYGGAAPCASGETKTVVSDPLAASSSGHTTTYCADSRAAVKKTVDASANATARTYDQDLNLSSQTRPGGGVTNYGYDAATRNLLCIQRGATSIQSCASASGGLKTTLAYVNTDSLTKYFPTRVTNPQGHSVALCYNGSTPACGTSSGPAGSLQSLTNGLSAQSVRRFAYNSKGKLTSSTDARNHATGYDYDAQGNLTKVTPPVGDGPRPLGSWTIAPDALSRPRTITDGKGQTSTYSYDGLDRVRGLDYPAGLSFGYTYDADGNRATLTDPGGTSVYSSDQLGRLEREEHPGGESNAYTYDGADNLRTLTDSGGTTTYAYNGLNQLASVTEPGDSTATTFAYNQDGAQTQIKYPSGVSVNRGHDLPSGRLTSVSNKAPSGSVLKSFAYTYRDTAGRDTDLRQTVTDEAGNKTTNSYDALDRLTAAVTTGGPVNPKPSRFVYAFDGNSNRTSQTINRDASTGGTTDTFAYDSASLPCWRFRGISSSGCGSAPSPDPTTYRTYTHDANGSDLNNTHQEFSYNAANQATSVTIWTRPLAAASLAYRGPGQSQPIRDGSYTLRHNRLGIGVRATGGQSRYYARADDGTLLSQRAPSGRRNYLYDGEGSVVGLTDGSGALKPSYSYEPYGHPPNTDSLLNENPFGYRGAYTAGVESDGVMCGGPNLGDGGYYDPQDGRLPQAKPLKPLFPPAQIAPASGHFKVPVENSGNVLDDIGNFFRFNPIGQVVSNCATGAAAGAAYVAPSLILPVVGEVTVGGGAAVGCAVGAGSSLGIGYNVTSVTSYK